MPTCKLCGCDVQKLAKSHIIPKSFYGSTLKNNDGPPIKIITWDENTPPKTARVGVYDSCLLCFACEAKTARYDDYAYKKFYQSEFVPLFPEPDAEIASLISPVDPALLRMFFASLLWRMDATKHPMFRGVKLGQKWRNKLSDALSYGRADELNGIDFVVSRLNGKLSELFISPHRIRFSGVNCYRVGVAHFSILLKVDSRRFGDDFFDIANRSRDFVIVLERNFDGSPEKKSIVELAKKVNLFYPNLRRN